MQQSYVPIKHDYEIVTTIPKKYSLSEYVSTMNNINKLSNFFVDSVKEIAKMAPFGNFTSIPIEKAAQLIYEHKLVPENILWGYFNSIIKKYRLCIIIDNYQFLPQVIKQQFETRLSDFKVGISIISIVRTEQDENKNIKNCTDFSMSELSLVCTDYNFFRSVVDKQLQNIFDLSIKEIDIKRIWEITDGNLKQLELIINDLRINPGYDIISVQSTIDNLDEIQKSILWVTALFPAGMKEDYLVQALCDILNETDKFKIKQKIMSLVHLGYIYINGKSQDAIKPTHETVVTNAKKSLNNYDVVLFQKQLSKSFENILLNLGKSSDYSYLLHCWIGVSTLDTLKLNANFVVDLITSKFKENAYYYIDSIAENLKPILYVFDEKTLERVLTSYQRVSDFRAGLRLLDDLKSRNQLAYNKHKLFQVKFLTQTYEFEDALELAKLMPLNTDSLLCKLNILQHLGRDNEAKQLLDNELMVCEKNDEYYIILRNTAHYLAYDEAMLTLHAALKYFEEKPFTDFIVATIKNNLGVINLWKTNIISANNYLHQAKKQLSRLQSNEIFEPLCNLSVSSLLSMNNNLAIEYAEEALKYCPKILTLDQLMLKVNLQIINLCCENYTVIETISNLQVLKDEFSTIDDPWYAFHLEFNLHQLNCINNTMQCNYSSKYVDDYYDGFTKYYLIEKFTIYGKITSLCLALSPNWRY